MSNAEVVRKFLEGEAWSAGRLCSTGHQLLSYGVVVGVREYEDGRLGVRVVDPEVSRTTTRQCGLLREMATSQGVEVIE